MPRAFAPSFASWQRQQDGLAGAVTVSGTTSAAEGEGVEAGPPPGRGGAHATSAARQASVAAARRAGLGDVVMRGGGSTDWLEGA